MAKRKYKRKARTVAASKWTLLLTYKAGIVLFDRDACPLRGGIYPLTWNHCGFRLEGKPCKYYKGLEGWGAVCAHPAMQQGKVEKYERIKHKKALEPKPAPKPKEKPKPPSEELTETQKQMQMALWDF